MLSLGEKFPKHLVMVRPEALFASADLLYFAIEPGAAGNSTKCVVVGELVWLLAPQIKVLDQGGFIKNPN